MKGKALWPTCYKCVARTDSLTLTVLSWLPVMCHLGMPIAGLDGGGGPQVAEVTRGGSPHLSCELDQIKMRNYMAGRSPHLSRLPYLPGVPPPLCKQALTSPWRVNGYAVGILYCVKVRRHSFLILAWMDPRFSFLSGTQFTIFT